MWIRGVGRGEGGRAKCELWWIREVDRGGGRGKGEGETVVDKRGGEVAGASGMLLVQSKMLTWSKNEV